MTHEVAVSQLRTGDTTLDQGRIQSTRVARNGSDILVVYDSGRSERHSATDTVEVVSSSRTA